MLITHDDLDYTVSRNGYSDREEWRLNGSLHSIDDNPSVIVNREKEIRWHKFGDLHRDEHNGPAWISKHIQIYYNLGNIHRVHGPAKIEKNILTWYTHGVISRNDGPAIENTYGKDEWWYAGKSFLDINDWAKVSNCDPELFVMLKLKYA